MTEAGDLSPRVCLQSAIALVAAEVLETYTEAELRRAFVVIEPGGYRIRRLRA